jgi:hypothetical protein
MSQRNSRDFTLSYNQRILLDMYIDFYNHTSREIDRLRDIQCEIRGNINQMIGINEQTSNSSNRSNGSNSGNNSNRSNRNNRNNSQNFRNNTERNNYRYYQWEPEIRRTVFDNIPYLIHDSNISRSGSNRINQPYAQQENMFSNILRSFYDRVPVAPTREQIEAVTRVVHFSDIENPINNSCPVTLDRFENNSSVTQIIPCGHIFSPSGIESWLQTNVRCPVCRYDIREYVVPNTTSDEQSGDAIVEEPIEPIEENEDNLHSEPDIQERNSIPRNTRNTNNTTTTNRVTYSNADIQNTISNITENIIGSLLNSSRDSYRDSYLFDPSFNSLIYDSSNNQFMFEGLLRRN